MTNSEGKKTSLSACKKTNKKTVKDEISNRFSLSLSIFVHLVSHPFQRCSSTWHLYKSVVPGPRRIRTRTLSECLCINKVCLLQIHLHHVLLSYAMESGASPACSEPEKQRDVPAAHSPDNTLLSPSEIFIYCPSTPAPSPGQLKHRCVRRWGRAPSWGGYACVCTIDNQYLISSQLKADIRS